MKEIIALTIDEATDTVIWLEKLRAFIELWDDCQSTKFVLPKNMGKKDLENIIKKYKNVISKGECASKRSKGSDDLCYLDR